MKRLVLFIALIIAGTVPAAAQTATPTPAPSATATATFTPTATGTLISIPSFPLMPTYAPTQLTPMVWGTLTPQPFGQPYHPPAAPVSLSIPDSGQQNGFNSIGETGSRALALWMADVAVTFWNWIGTNADGVFDALRYFFAVVMLAGFIIHKIRKWQNRPKPDGLPAATPDSIKEFEKLKAAARSRRTPAPKPISKREAAAGERERSKWILTVIPFLMLAQNGQCGGGAPCGQIPWSLPQFPVISSPTPFPSAIYTAIVTATATPTPGAGTPTAIPPTATTGVNTALIDTQLQTLAAFAAATPFEYAPALPPQNITDNVQRVMSFGMGLQAANFGIFQPFIQIGFFGFFTWLGLRLTFMILPIVTGFVGVIRKVIDLLLQFLPF